MNKKGSAFFGITIGVYIFIMGILIIPYLTDSIDEARVNLQCENAGISDGIKLTCLLHDAVIPYFILFIMSVVVGFFVGGYNL